PRFAVDGVAGRSSGQRVVLRRADDVGLTLKDEVGPGNCVSAGSRHSLERDRALTIDRNDSFGCAGLYYHPGVKVGVGDTEAAQVNPVLTAIRVGVEADDPVMTEVR